MKTVYLALGLLLLPGMLWAQGSKKGQVGHFVG